MPINEKKMAALKKQYGAKKGKEIYYKMENKSKSERKTTGKASSRNKTGKASTRNKTGKASTRTSKPAAQRNKTGKAQPRKSR